MSSNVSGRIQLAFENQQAEGKRALIAYLTAGDPSPEHTVGLVLALERGGVDIIELGVPFSDPIADGPVIQKAAQRALKAGTNLKTVLQLVRDVRKESEIPLVVFSYLNPILRYGFRQFAKDAAAAGADGALLTDLNIEEADAYVSEMRSRGLDCIFLVSQNTPQERIAEIARCSSGFIYLVSRAGVTGIRSDLSSAAIPLLQRTREITLLPLALGFGLSTREHMEQVSPYVDGAVIGSAFMQQIEEHTGKGALENCFEEMARDFKLGLVHSV